MNSEEQYKKNEMLQTQIKHSRSKRHKSMHSQLSPWSSSGSMRMQHIGFRKLARAYLLGSSRNIDRYGRYGGNGIMVPRNYAPPPRLPERYNFEESRNTDLEHYHPDHIYPRTVNRYSSENELRLVKGKNNNGNTNWFHERSSNSHIFDVRAAELEVNYKSSTSLPLPPIKPEKTSIDVIISDIPDHTGLDSIISQVRGGQLSKLTIFNTKYSNDSLKFVVVTFCHPKDAEAFVEFGKTNLFKVNGIHVKVDWYFDEFKSPYNYWTESTTSSYHNNMKTTRCLILKKNEKKKIVTKHGVVVENGVIPFDESTIEDDFSIFGNIQGITPVISRRVCISIHFMDILGAMRAMHSFSQRNSDIHKKYHYSWSMWYGGDITARPCIT